MAEENIEVGLKADTRSFVQSFNDAATAAKNVVGAVRMIENGFDRLERMAVSKMRTVTRVVAGVTATTAATATTGVVAFAKFEASMRNFATVADESVMSVGRVSEEIRKMATMGGLPKTVEDLSEGMYEVASSGFQGAEGLSVLQRSAEFAIAGLTDTQTAVKGVTSILNAYGMGASKAADVTNVLFKAVEIGQMSAGEFIQQVGDWSAVASTLGVSVEEASAAIASLTRGGMQAAPAATAFSGVLRQLIRPSDEMAKMFRRLGYESGKAAIEQDGLVVVLNKLWEAAGESEATFGQMFQDVEGLRGALTLVTTQAETFADTTAEMENKLLTNGTVSRAMAKQMEGLGMQFQLTKNHIREMAINMGALLAGPAKTGLSTFNSLLAAINGLPQPLRNVVSLFQLAFPAIAAVTGAFVLMAAKAWLVNKALLQMVKIKFLANFAAAVINAGGPMSYLLLQIRRVTGASGAMRIALLKASAATLAMGAAAVGAAYGLYKIFALIKESREQAEELMRSFGDPSAFEGVDRMALSLSRVNAELDRTRYAAEGNWLDKLGRGLGAFAQVITPFTRNTLLNDLNTFEAGSDAEKAYLDQQRALELLVDKNDSAIQRINEAWKSGLISTREMVDQTYEYTGNRITQALQKGVIDWEIYQSAVTTQQRLRESMTGKSSAEKQKIRDSGEWKAAQKIIDDTARTLRDFVVVTKEVERAQEAASVTALDLEMALLAIADKASGAKERLAAYNDIIDNTIMKSVSMRDSQAALGEALRNMYVAFKENGPVMDPFTEKGAKVQEAISRAAQAAQAMADQVKRQTGSVDLANAAMATYVQGMIQTAEKAGWSRESIAEMIRVMGLTPEMIQTIVTLPGADHSLAQLFGLDAGLSAINGRVVNAMVRIGIVIDTRQGTADTMERYAQKATPLQQINDAMNDIISGVNRSLRGWSPPASRSGGGGGGGGGVGGTPKWTMPPELRRVVEATLRRNIDVVLDGIGNKAAVADEARRLKTWYAVAYLKEATNRTSAAIYKAADAAGEDPSDKILSLADAYNRAVAILGEAQAKMSLNMYDSLESYEAFVDELERIRAEQRAIEDWKFDEGRMGASKYLEILRARLVGLKKYSEEWRDIMSAIKRVEQQVLDEEKERGERRIAKQKRIRERQVALGRMSIADYVEYLKQLRNTYKKHSDEWWALQDEIDGINRRSAETAKSWAEQVGDAMRSAFESVVDPIRQATSLITAFGQQSNISMSQVQDFYGHMKEGVTRWVDAIRTLKDRGLNAKTLNELISAGPSSLGFAESLVAMGSDGVSFINQSVADIDALASGLGSEIATSSVGTLIQNQQTYNLDVGDISLVFDPRGTTLTIADVNAAIQAAFQDFARSLTPR